MSLAIVFPGQGSQSVGMLGTLAADFPVVRETFDEASEVLGYDLWELTQSGPEQELNLTHCTQPAMLTAGVAVWRVWQAGGGCPPSVMAGHSLGEYTALVCSGALAFADAVGLVSDRGRFMQEAVLPGAGAVAAVLGLGEPEVRRACEQAARGEVVSPVNFNSPGQVVIAGHATAVDRAVALAKAAGAKRAIILPVSVPVHCSLMEPAAHRLRERLAEIEIRAPLVPIINNVDAAEHSEPYAIRDALVRQLHGPVRWLESVNTVLGRGIHTVLEFGPGKVLTGLNKTIARAVKEHSLAGALNIAAVYDSATIQKALTWCVPTPCAAAG